jgi:Protein of unknown function (DUF3987)
MTKPTSVSKANPCPHCGKPDWCYSIGDLSVCNRDHEPANGWTKTKGLDSNGKPYYALIESQVKKESAKPTIVKTTIYPYLSRTGEELVQVIRQDLSNGKKKIVQKARTGQGWVYSTRHIDRSSIPIYRYQEIRKAIDNQETIFFVEGEGVADCLVALGLQATTNLRGSGGLSSSDLEDLEGAELVICPDRDKPGIKLANKVAEKFPAAKWLYAFPESPLWSHLTDSGGADLKNWVDDYQLKADDLLKAIEPKREIGTIDQKLQILGFTDLDYKKRDQVREAIDNLIERQQPESDKLATLTELANLFKWDDRKLITYYQLRLKELEEEETQEETQSEIDSILDSMNDDIDIADYVDPILVPNLLRLSTKLRYKQSSVLTALMTAISILHKVGTVLWLEDGFYVSPNLNSLLVSPSGQGKSPMMKALITEPFSKIEQEYQKVFEAAWTNYEQDSAEFSLMGKNEQRDTIKREGLPTRPPEAPRILFATDLNTIAVAKQFRHYPEQGFIGIYDEAKKLFNFKGGGRENDESNLLSLYDGSPIKELRAGENRANIAATLFGIYGLIQPRILLSLMGDDGDEQGKWARFLYTFQGKEAKVYSLKYGTEKTSLSEDLATFYRSILKLPKRTYTLTVDSQLALSIYLTEGTEKERMAHSDNILEKFYGKSASRIAKLIVNLHLLQGNSGLEKTVIDDMTVYRAIELDDYYCKQIKILHSKSRAQKGELAPKLVEILKLSRDKTLPITARQVQSNSWIFRKDKEGVEQIRQYFQQLESMGYGVCQGAGNRTTFEAK